MKTFEIVIVGAGHGGAQAAIMLRQLGFEGSIALIGDEPEPPYERPPLSKDYLSGDKEFERILIRPAHFWEERQIVLLTNMRIEQVDPEAHVLTAADGTTIGYGKLIWAAGGAPRLLTCQGGDLAGVHVVRRRDEVDAIRSELDAANRVVVIGGGYIGLEAAAVLAGLGKQVVIVETLDRVLARVAGAPISSFYQKEHAARGVEIRLGATVDHIIGEDERAAGVHLTNGDRIEADMVIVGIGILPSVQPLLAAGAAGGNGVDVDNFCRTSLPDIYAIGDCAAHENDFAGGARIRLESVQNANDQAGTAVKSILGQAEPYAAVPWFWSNQYDLKLQTVGFSAGHDQIVLRGNPDDRSFSLIYLREGRVIALDCVNAIRDYVQGRKLVVDGLKPSPDKLADTSLPLKSLAE